MGALTLVVDDATSLRTLFEDHLSKGRAFVPGEHDVAARATCELHVLHRGRMYRLFAEVVHVRAEDPGRGVGLAIPKTAPENVAVLRDLEGLASRVAVTADAGEPPLPENESVADDGSGEETGPTSLHERVRTLSGAEQLRLAAAGTLAERTTLERLYGPTVWETLLRNPRITVPEVARIARKGSLPRPLVDLVAASSTWLASGEVQRALLSNPRSSPTVVQKVLSAMSRHDLLLVPQQTAYPEPVRAAAKKRLGR